MIRVNSSPQNKTSNVPNTKNGPNGTVLPFNFFFPRTIKISERNAPDKNAAYNPITILGNPSNNPIKNAYFTSPNPIPLPFVPRNRSKKNKHAPSAEPK